MTVYIGKYNSFAVFADTDNFVVIDPTVNMVVESGKLADISNAKKVSRSKEVFSQEVQDLATSALELMQQPSLTASARLYTIPSGVQAEAKKALAWRKEHKRGGTPVGLNTARTLAKGGQIGIEKVRHIAKYFPRHEVDKKGKGWKPGEDNFPSNGRIAWALWGGDAAWRWAKAIVERDDKLKAKTASGLYELEVGNGDLTPFNQKQYMEESITPDFLARIRLDGSGIDRIYKVDLDGCVYVWDDGCWDDLGSLDGDVWTYDKALDDPYDVVEKTHVMIDPESALIICAKLHTNPDKNISIAELDEEEAMLAMDGMAEEDLDFIDEVITAAGDSMSQGQGDGEYTSEERSQNVQKQPRDASGLFVKVGNKVTVAGKSKGTLTKVNNNGTVSVTLDNGNSVDVDPKLTKVDDGSPLQPTTPANPMNLGRPLDVEGILGEPRTPIGSKAQLPGTLPMFTPQDTHDLLNRWSSWVSEQRNSFKPKTATFANEETEEVEDLGGVIEYDHPLLIEWHNKKQQESKNIASNVGGWTSGVTAAATPSDVQPIYLAIVSPEDPRAVFDLISIVPASATSNQPMTYVRKEKKWVREPKFLADLKSATPPPVVPLNKKVLNSVLTQIDSLTASAYSIDMAITVLWGPRLDVMEFYAQDVFNEDLESLFAAGGADRNRGNAEKLRRYWTRGEGAAKIRWGTPGDWKRCVRYLSKYLGVRAKGYCQLRHKEATGVYTGSRLNPGNENSTQDFIMEEVWGENIGEPTKITEKDLLMPTPDIMGEKDDIYDHHWKPSAEIVTALKELNKCGDDEFVSLTAGARPPSAWNIDKNRKNAEKLRRYWTKGKGAAKIRWNTGGDWKRCVRYLSKYLGPRAKGYCALRHKEVTGMWTGDTAHLEMYGGGRRKRNLFGIDSVNVNTSEEVLRINAERSAEEYIPLVASLKSDEIRFVIPLVIPEETESGDGRSFKKGAISFRELPLPLMWQTHTADGHNGSVVVGRIDHMERIDGGIGNCHGVFDSGAQAQEVVRLIRNGFIKGISADMDRFEATQIKEEAEENSEDEKTLGKDKIVINKARVMGITIVPKPAFQECKIQIPENNNQEETVISDGIYVDDADSSDASSLVACGIVADAIPVTPPATWFENPKLSKATPLTVTDDGQVFGHIAAWAVDHIGLTAGTKPPRSRSNYAYFHTGVCRTDNGKDVPVGQLTLAGGHASLYASAKDAVKHYDDTASAVADVHAGEDSFGIWVAGALRPGTTPEQIRALRASAPSGDWRPIKGSLELVAVCQVNVPGFPIARAVVAGGQVMALVAAGAMTLAKMKSDPIAELNERLANLEKANNSNEVDLVSKAQELSNKLDSVFAEIDAFADISRAERKSLAEKGHALPDGSYPIRNVEDLKNAIQAYGRSKKSDRKKVRNHIIKRAKALKQYKLVPEEWKVASTQELDLAVDSMRSKIAELSAIVAAPVDTLPFTEGEQPKKSDAVEPIEPVDENVPTVESGLKDDGKYTPKTQPRDEQGKFRQVLARLKQDLGTSGLQSIVEDAKTVEKLHEIGDYANSANAAVKLLDIIDRLDSGALNKVSLENVRSSASELGKVISNLPLGFNNQAEKIRYSDLPPALKNLMDSMMERVEKKIGKKDADVATADLKSFKSGSEVYSQGEISAQMSKMLRLLTQHITK